MADTVLYYTTCLKIERTDSTVIGLTEHDQPISYAGVDYLPYETYNPTAIQNRADLSVNNVDIEGILSDSDRLDIKNKLYDNARIELFVYDWNAGSFIKMLQVGHWGEAKLYQGRYVTEFRSLSQKLNQNIGRNYGICDADLGDTRCGVNKASFTVTGTITSVTSSAQFTDSSRSEDDGYFQYGEFTFTSGNNSGIQREVYSFASGVFVAIPAFPYTIQIGDAYSAVAGCDREHTTCNDKFNNIINHRGSPFAVGQDSALEIGSVPA